MSMYNLTEYSDNCLKKFGSLQQYDRDEPAMKNAGIIINFFSEIASFKCKQEITNKTENNGTEDVE